MHANIVCLSHLRWNFVYQRPNHLTAHAARTHRVFFVEEPERNGTAPRIGYFAAARRGETMSKQRSIEAQSARRRAIGWISYIGRG